MNYTRCIHCGAYTTGMTQAEYQAQHGVGICTSPCHYCNEGVMHAPQTCANVREGGMYPPMVRDFLDYHKQR